MAEIEIVTTLEGFKALKPTWDELYAQNHHNRVFQSFCWNMAVWQGFHVKRRPDERLFIVHARQAEDLPCHAILPFCIDKRGCLHLIGYGMSDVLSEIAPSHTDNWHGFYLQIIQFLQKCQEVKGIAFANLEDTSEILRFFGVYWEDCVVSKCDAISYFEAKESQNLAEAIPHLPSSSRSKIRKLSRRHSEYDFVIFSKEKGDDYPEAQLKQLRQFMIDGKMRVEAALPVEYIDTLKAVYEAGMCEIPCLVDRESGAFVYAAYRLLGMDNIVFWVVLYRKTTFPSSVNAKYILAKLGGCPYTFDFGTGVYPYKLSNYLPHVQNLYALSIHPENFWSFLSDGYWLLRRYLKVLLVSLKAIKARR